jgi:hypothetical protein
LIFAISAPPGRVYQSLCHNLLPGAVFDQLQDKGFRLFAHEKYARVHPA